MSLRILRGVEGFIQYLNDLLWLDIFELTAKFVIHRCPHHATHSRMVIKSLQISISRSTRSVSSKFFRCLIYKHIQNFLVLQDDLQFLIPAIEVGFDELVAVQQQIEG